MTTWRGLSKQTGRQITEADHIQQSIQDILTTPLGSRVMRREYGCEIFELIDQPNGAVTRLRLMAATVSALTLWEPRIRITHVDVSTPEATGKCQISLVTERLDGQRNTMVVNV